MTDQKHPMIPPNILLNNWENDWYAQREHADVLLIQAYQAGADAELEACCEWLESKPDPGHVDLLWSWWSCATALRAARRPKPPSLKEQALAAAAEFEGFKGVDIIRRALEALPDDL